MAGALTRWKERPRRSDRRGRLEAWLGGGRLPPAAVHAPVTAAPAMTVMAIPPMMIPRVTMPTVMIPTVTIPIYRRYIVLVGDNRGAQRRNRRSLRGPRSSHHQQCCDRHRKHIRVILTLLAVLLRREPVRAHNTQMGW